jgi:hypothetical protein
VGFLWSYVLRTLPTSNISRGKNWGKLLLYPKDFALELAQQAAELVSKKQDGKDSSENDGAQGEREQLKPERESRGYSRCSGGVVQSIETRATAVEENPPEKTREIKKRCVLCGCRCRVFQEGRIGCIGLCLCVCFGNRDNYVIWRDGRPYRTTIHTFTCYDLDFRRPH